MRPGLPPHSTRGRFRHGLPSPRRSSQLTKHTGRIFLITGVSTGLGRAFALGALQAGHTVAGTVRQARDANSFHALEPERAHPYLLAVTHDREVVRVIHDVESTVGPIDVLISNA